MKKTALMIGLLLILIPIFNVAMAQTPVSYILKTVKTGTGAGKVTSSPAGINCGTDCSQTYTKGTRITLTETPASRSHFAGWAGYGGCSGGSKAKSCVLTMIRTDFVTARFDLNPTPTSTPTGGITPTPTPGGLTPTPVSCDLSHGDANCDGKIDLIDFNLWRQQFTTTVISSADFNSDGKVDLVDFNIWRTNAQL